MNTEPETALEVEGAARSLLQETEALLDGWLTKEQAAERLQTTERTIARWVAERKIGTKKSARHGKKPLTLCDPVDVERLQSEMAKGAVLPPDSDQQRNFLEMSVIAKVPQMIAQVAHAISTSGTGTAVRPFMELDEASRYSGLPRRLLVKLIQANKLPALTWSKEYYVKKKDLDNMEACL